MRDVFLALALFYPAAVTSGCRGGCTELSCGPVTTVEIVGEMGDLVPGNYDVELQLDDLVATCLAPGGECLDASGTAVAARFEVIPGSDGDGVAIRGEIDVQPETVRVALLREGAVLGETLQEMSYVTTTPNGKDCSPECRSGGTIKLIVAE